LALVAPVLSSVPQWLAQGWLRAHDYDEVADDLETGATEIRHDELIREWFSAAPVPRATTSPSWRRRELRRQCRPDCSYDCLKFKRERLGIYREFPVFGRKWDQPFLWFGPLDNRSPFWICSTLCGTPPEWNTFYTAAMRKRH
jgi:hypothetical protein